MAIAHDVRNMRDECESILPSMIKGLRLAAKRPIDPRRVAGARLIQASAYLLKTLRYDPVQGYEFDQIDGGLCSNQMSRELDHLDGAALRSARPDRRVEDYPQLVKALERGDDFIITLSCAVGIRDRNIEHDTCSLVDFHARCHPSQRRWIEEAWAYMEENKWPVTSR
jgi:hypothetical protein